MFSTRITWVKEENKAEMAAPASKSRMGDKPPLPKEPSANTTAAASAAPAKPMAISTGMELTENNTAANTTKKLAPALIPRIPGDARGFRVRVCMMAPATAKLLPTTAAIKARGRRVVRMIICSIMDSL
ncbi:hypothetical protein D3C81_1882390 [compost metagenome]